MSDQIENTIDSHFSIIDSNIDVSVFAARLEQNPDDWHYAGMWTNTSAPIPYGIIPLTVAAPPANTNVNDTEVVYNTSYYDKYNDIRSWVSGRGYEYIARCAFLSLGPGSATEIASVQGKYFENKHRHCLVIKGTGIFTIDGKEYEVGPGTLYQYNPQRLHADINTGDDDKWLFMFDVFKMQILDQDQKPIEELRGDSGDGSVS